MNALGNADQQEVGRWANNRVENSHLPFRGRERAMNRFRKMDTLQNFSSVHASVRNLFNQERHLTTGRPKRTNAQPPWLSGAPSRADAGWGPGVLRSAETSCR